MLSAGVAFQQQFWRFSVAGGRLPDAQSHVPKKGWVADLSAADRISRLWLNLKHKPKAAAVDAAAWKTCPVIGTRARYFSSSPVEDDGLDEPHDGAGLDTAGLGEAQLGSAGAGAGAGAGADIGGTGFGGL